MDRHWGDAFFNRLGATVSEKTFCASGLSTGYLITVGPTGSVDPEGLGVSAIADVTENDIRKLAREFATIKFEERIQRDDMFLVVRELFIANNAKDADIVLAARQAEQLEVTPPWGTLS